MSDSPSFELSPSVVESLSWRLMAELKRRHPEAGTLIETHPGGGQYDCLTLLKDNQCVASLNRRGGFTVFQRNDAYIPAESIWLPCLSRPGIHEALNKMSAALGLQVPAPVPSTTPETLAYSVIARVLSLHVLDRKSWECRNGQDDTAGEPNQQIRDEWFAKVPTAKAWRRSIDPSQSPFGLASYHVWFLLHDGRPQGAISTDGNFHSLDGRQINFFAIYKQRRRVEEVLATVLPCLST